MLSGDPALRNRAFFDREDGFTGFPIEAENQTRLCALQNRRNCLAIVFEINERRL